MSTTEWVRAEAGRRLEPEQQALLLEQAKAGYADGMSLRQLGERHGRSYGAMNLLLKRGGVQVRGRGGANGRGQAAG